MNLVYEYSLAAIRHMDGHSDSDGLRGGQPHDPSAYEISRLVEVFGPHLSELGIGPMEGPQDVAPLVHTLRVFFTGDLAPVDQDSSSFDVLLGVGKQCGLA